MVGVVVGVAVAVVVGVAVGVAVGVGVAVAVVVGVAVGVAIVVAVGVAVVVVAVVVVVRPLEERRRMKMDLVAEADFRKWLEAQGYAPTTIVSTVRMVKRAMALHHEHRPIAPHKVHIQRWLAFQAERDKTDYFTRAMRHMFAPAVAAPQGERNDAPLTKEEWTRLKTALLNDGDPVARVVYAIAHTENPSRDTTSNLTEPMKVFKELVDDEAKQYLSNLRGATLLEAISPTSKPASLYQRLRRKLGLVAESAIGRPVTFLAIERTRR